MTWRPRGRGCFTQYSVQIDETNLPASSPSQFALSELAKEAWNWAQVLNTPNKNTPYVASHSRVPSPPPSPSRRLRLAFVNTARSCLWLAKIDGKFIKTFGTEMCSADVVWKCQRLNVVCKGECRTIKTSLKQREWQFFIIWDMNSHIENCDVVKSLKYFDLSTANCKNENRTVYNMFSGKANIFVNGELKLFL